MNETIQSAIRLVACSLVLATTACKEDLAVEEITVGAAPEIATGKEFDEQVTAAVAELSDRSGVVADAIVVVQARAVNWGSSALGCPRKDMDYTQAIVPGVLLLLEADGRLYRYHGRRNSKPFYCPDDRAEAPAYGQGEEFM